eukprot:6460808-Amphidinium_carterae.1
MEYALDIIMEDRESAGGCDVPQQLLCRLRYDPPVPPGARQDASSLLHHQPRPTPQPTPPPGVPAEQIVKLIQEHFGLQWQHAPDIPAHYMDPAPQPLL